MVRCKRLYVMCARKIVYHEYEVRIDKSIPRVSIWHNSASLEVLKVTLGIEFSATASH